MSGFPYLSSCAKSDLRLFQKQHSMRPLPYCCGDRGAYTRNGNWLDLWSYKTNVMHAEIVTDDSAVSTVHTIAVVDVLWHKYTQTTMNHINAFLRMLREECDLVMVNTDGYGGYTNQTHFTAAEWKRMFCEEVA